MVFFNCRDIDTYLFQFLSIKTVCYVSQLNQNALKLIKKQNWFPCLVNYSDFIAFNGNTNLNFNTTFLKMHLLQPDNTIKNISTERLGRLIQNCNFESVKYILQMPIKKKLFNTKLILYGAIATKNIKIVKLLIYPIINLSPLLYFEAIKHNFLEALLYFGDYEYGGVNPEIMNELYLNAIKNKHYDMVKYIYTQFATSIKQQIIKIEFACVDLEMFKIVYNNHKKFNTTIDIVDIVSCSGNIEILDWLNECGYNVYTNNTLVNATRNLHFETIKHIIRKNADLTLYSTQLLILACYQASSTIDSVTACSLYNIVEYYLDIGADSTFDDYIALRSVSISVCLKTFKLILDNVIEKAKKLE